MDEKDKKIQDLRNIVSQIICDTAAVTEHLNLLDEDLDHLFKVLEKGSLI